MATSEQAIPATAITTQALRPHLEACGYRGPLLRSDFEFGTAGGVRRVALAGFAHEPADVRSICFAATDVSRDSAHGVEEYRDLGAPLVLVCRREHLELWKQSAGAPQLHREILARDIDSFFREERLSLSPEAIYRAKTQGRFQPSAQLDFVDIGLLPVVEAQLGRWLSKLVEGFVSDVKRCLGETITQSRGEWLLREVFWLLAAKILHDKAVPNFRRLDLAEIEDARQRVARHYGASQPARLSRREHRALLPVGEQLARFASLAQVTTESLAFVYENALISKETRTTLGTHSTPNAVVEYVVGRLAPHISRIPVDQRRVFEPACGHAGFLVAAMRLLRDQLPSSVSLEDRKRYLRQRLVGIEVDAFAVEIARLSLTLADIPNPNGWQLHCGDMFAGNALERHASRATVLLSNPPFETFTQDQRQRYSAGGAEVAPNKAFEMLRRVLPRLPAGAVLGLVLKQSFLQNSQAEDLRQLLVREFDILELCLLPDNIFEISYQETVLVLATRGRASRAGQHLMSYKRVRESDAGRFQQAAEVTTSRDVPQERFEKARAFDLRVPDLEELWTFRQLRRVADFAIIGKGLEYKGEDDLPTGRTPISSKPFPKAVPGFEKFPRGGVALHSLPPTMFLSLEEDDIRRPGLGTTVQIPQVLLPYAPVSRSPWRLTALLDRKGHAVTSRFLVVRPRVHGLALEFFWALFNSPYANAYIYTHADKRSILPSIVRQMPTPELHPTGIERVTTAARSYLELVGSEDVENEELHERLLQVDAEVLRLYDLPPRIERTLLRLFAGHPRPGVPFTFDRYYPAGVESAVPLYMRLSEGYRRAKPSRLLAQEARRIPLGFIEALKRSTDDYQD